MTSPFTESELRSLLGREEGQYLEFKSLWDQTPGQRRPLGRHDVRDMIAKHVAAFANADGGALVLGVEDDGTPSGHGYPPEEVEKFFNVPSTRLRLGPTGEAPVSIRTQTMLMDGQEILIFHVAPAAQAVMVEGDGFPYRTSDSTVQEPQEIINDRKESYRRVGFEQQVRPDATLDDLDFELIARLLHGLVKKDATPARVLEAYGLLLPRAHGAGVTNAALLLFGKPPLARWHPNASIRFFRVAGTEVRPGTARNVTQLERVELPIAAAIAEAHRVAAQNVRKSEKLHHLFFREVPEYPDFAWQEAIVNAIGHRDYADQGRGVEVWFFDDRLEVRSPGGLVPPVTLEQLRSGTPVHSSRNPRIARILVEAGIMREEGEGVPRIFAEMSESFLRRPEFDVEASTFTVTLRNTPVFEGPSKEWREVVERLPLSVAQRRAMLAHPEGFKSEDFQALNDLDRDQAYREIRGLVDMGAVVVHGQGRGASYSVSPELLDTRTWLESRLPALRTFFTANSQLKNADFRQLFGIASRSAATRELGRLVQAGYLTMEGERRGVRYRPGVKLGGPPAK